MPSPTRWSTTTRSVLRGLDGDIDEIEHEVFSGPKATHGERIFKLKREVLEFRRAVDPLAAPLEELAARDQTPRRRARRVLP